ncbi:MAG TPA: hypothetical protein VFA30_04145 [Gaiellaceae bacterium]|nr:hypothetical protein [Gaiellaceae bacterium]
MKTRGRLVRAVVSVVGAVALVAAIAVFGFHAPQRIAHWWSCNSGGPGAPSWSPDSRWIAFAAVGGCDTEVVAIRPDGTARRVIASSFSYWPAWSPKGDDLLVDTRHGYAVVSTTRGTPYVVIAKASDMGAAWSPHGDLIAFTHGFLPSIGDDEYRSTLYVATANGSIVRSLVGHSCDPGGPAWSPDGRAIAVGCYDGLYVVDPKTGVARRILKRDFGAEPPTPSWSPDGRSIVFLDYGYGGVYVVAANGRGHMRRLVSVDSDGWTDTAAWSPDGRWIAYSLSTGARTDGLYIMRSNGKDAHRIARF